MAVRPHTESAGRFDSRQASLPAGTINIDPPRLCARMDTASWTSTLTDSIQEAGESNPSKDVISAGQSGRLEACSSTSLI